PLCDTFDQAVRELQSMQRHSHGNRFSLNCSLDMTASPCSDKQSVSFLRESRLWPAIGSSGHTRQYCTALETFPLRPFPLNRFVEWTILILHEWCSESSWGLGLCFRQASWRRCR